MSNQDLITLRNPLSPIAEAYRTLRTNIQFSSFDIKVKVVCITSTAPGDGKSTVAANLAVVTAESGKRTLLIDCDQRKARLHKVFSLSNLVGLSNLLANEVDFDNAVQKTVIPNLSVITAGTKPPNPSELLSSEKMRDFVGSLREVYDFVIIDLPPLLAVTDAQLLAGYTDGYLLVVASGETDRAAAAKAKDLLEKVNAKILGAVITKVDMSDRGFYEYYYHSDTSKKKGFKLFSRK